MPFFANKLSSRDTEARLYSVVGQIETVHNVARIFLRDEFRDHYPNGTVVFGAVPSGCPDNKNCHFNAALEPYGLPMGFNTQTIFNQDISLVATRKLNEGGDVVVNGYIKLSRGDLTDSNLEWAQLLRMLGFYASGNNSNINESTEIHITVPVEEPYTDVVLRRETDENIGFLTELDMGENTIKNINNLYANKGDATKAIVYNLSLSGDVSIDTPVLKAITTNFIGSVNALSPVPALSLSGAQVKTAKAMFKEMICTDATITSSSSVRADDLKLAVGNTFEVNEGSTCTFNGDVLLKEGTVNVLENDMTVKQIFGVSFESGAPHVYAERTKGIIVRDTLFVDKVLVAGGEPFFCDRISGCGDNFGNIYGVQEPAGDSAVTVTNVWQNKNPVPGVLINLTDDNTISLIPDVLLDQINNVNIPMVYNPYLNITSKYRCGDADGGVFDMRSGFFVNGNLEKNKNSLVYNILCQYFLYHRLERRLNHKLRIKCGAHCNI